MSETPITTVVPAEIPPSHSKQWRSSSIPLAVILLLGLVLRLLYLEEKSLWLDEISSVTFARLDWDFEVGRSPIPVLSAVRPDQALKEMKYLSYIHAGKVFSGSVPKSDPREPDQPRLKSRGSAIMTR